MLQLTVVFVIISQVWGSDQPTEGIFTSNVDLQRLLITEGEIITELKEYIQVEEARLDKLRQYVAKYEKIHQKAEEDAEKYVGNPLNSYLLIKRLTADWKGVRQLIGSRLGDNVINQLANKTQQYMLTWPTDEDLSGAAVALTRLQDTYRLRPGDMSEGKLSGKAFDTKLSASDCFELGRQSYNNGNNKHTIQWMEQAMKNLEDEKDNPTIDTAEIYEYYAFALYSVDDIEKALHYTKLLLKLQPDHPRAEGNIVYYEEYLANNQNKKYKKGDDESDDLLVDSIKVESSSTTPSWQLEHEKYTKLCRGEGDVDEKKRAKLKCRYNFGKHPYLTFMPYKEEVMSLDPKLSMFYEVLSDREIESIKGEAFPRLKRATVQSSSGDLVTADYRVSKTAWLKRDENEHTKRIFQRVGDVTGLNMESSEDLQISSYGIGGHYEPHFDFARPDEECFTSMGTGNRIATWLFYGSDVELGGATVFPKADLTLFPKKGAAAFWYNLHKNGEGNFNTRHAACPVLAGTKIVSNFWIHERGQEFTRPCSLNPFK